jgi:hypothetical protein
MTGEKCMASLETQKKILTKTLDKNRAPFVQTGDEFVWSGRTKIKSNSTGRIYDIQIEIHVKTQKRLESQVSACLCKQEGVRFEDLLIISMIDPRLVGDIAFVGLPKGDMKHNLVKFLKQLG